MSGGFAPGSPATFASAPRNTRERGFRAVVARHARTLAAAGVASSEVDARLLAAHVLGSDRGEPPAADDPRLTELDRLVGRRAERMPLQLLTGSTGFRRLDLECRPGVFVPRPETEVVAGIAIDHARRVIERAPVVVDLCTGCGAIALSVVAEVAGAKVVAADADSAAVALARDNLDRLVTGRAGMTVAADAVRCTVVAGDLFAPVDAALRGCVDVVAANPPYLPTSDLATLPPEVASHDPRTALIGGADGHEVVERILTSAPDWLAPDGAVVIEIDARSGAHAIASAERLGYRTVVVEPDLTGADRVLVARWRGSR